MAMEGGRSTQEAGLVGMHHVGKAVQEMFSSAKIQGFSHSDKTQLPSESCPEIYEHLLALQT